MPILVEDILLDESSGLICVGIILLIIILIVIFKILFKVEEKREKENQQQSREIEQKCKEQIEEGFRKHSFSPDVRIDLRPEKVERQKFSFLIDEKSKQIAFTRVGPKCLGMIVKFSEIEDVHLKINDETLIKAPSTNYYGEEITSLEQYTFSTFINSVFLYIDTNKLSEPIYKWGIILKEPLLKSDPYAKDLIDWYYKVYSAINQDCGWMGEASTEILTIKNLHFSK